MNILVLYKDDSWYTRNTINEHIQSFKKYAENTRVHYFNVHKKIPKFLKKIPYDGIILHTTFLAQRYHLNNEKWHTYTEGIGQLSGYKVALPQDDYYDTDKLCTLFKEHNVETVFTILPEKEQYYNAYPPEKSGIKHYIPVLTGYIDRKSVV